MSAEIINLRNVRKQKQRQDKQKIADDNRLKFGRTKAERDAARQRRDGLEKHIEGHRLDSSDAPDGDGAA